MTLRLANAEPPHLSLQLAHGERGSDRSVAQGGIQPGNVSHRPSEFRALRHNPFAEIQRTLATQPHEDGWWIPRRNYFWGHALQASGWWPDHQLRLLRRANAHYDLTQHVHEVATLAGAAGYLTEPMLHLNYDSWREFWRKQQRYAEHEGYKLAERGLRWKPRNMLLQPLRAFHRRFVTWQGWRDGPIGLQLALAMAWWEGVAYWELRRVEREKREGI